MEKNFWLSFPVAFHSCPFGRDSFETCCKNQIFGSLVWHFICIEKFTVFTSEQALLSLCVSFVPTENLISLNILELRKVFFINVQPTKIDPFSMPNQSLEKVSPWMTRQADRQFRHQLLDKRRNAKDWTRMRELNGHDCINFKTK